MKKIVIFIIFNVVIFLLLVFTPLNSVADCPGCFIVHKSEIITMSNETILGYIRYHEQGGGDLKDRAYWKHIDKFKKFHNINYKINSFKKSFFPYVVFVSSNEIVDLKPNEIKSINLLNEKYSFDARGEFKVLSEKNIKLLFEQEYFAIYKWGDNYESNYLISYNTDYDKNKLIKIKESYWSEKYWIKELMEKWKNKTEELDKHNIIYIHFASGC